MGGGDVGHDGGRKSKIENQNFKIPKFQSFKISKVKSSRDSNSEKQSNNTRRDWLTV